MSATKQTADQNRALARRINEEVWNNQNLDLVPLLFTEDFVADYSPRVMRYGHAGVVEMVTSAHATFEGFREELKGVVADDTHVVVHFTISGIQVADWGPIPATNKPVKYDEIVIMRVRDGRVCTQRGVADTLLAFQQIGLLPDPGGFVERSFREGDS